MVEGILIAMVAAVAGAFGAILGIGGGIILVPILVSFFAVDVEHARSASLASVVVTSMGGSLIYLREGVGDIVRASYLQLPTAIGAVGGAYLGARLDDKIIRLLFGLFIILVSIRLMFAKDSQSNFRPHRGHWALAMLACLGAGLVSAVLGVGGGIVFVPVIILLLAQTPRVAAATSTFLIGLTGAASALIYAKAGQMDYELTLIAATGIFFGAQIGARISKWVSGKMLRKAFAVILLINAYLLISKVILQ
ncbi:MAG TPA: sulfite exporter TauE/SafE family protein [Fimbriimonadales bacterium]|nr:sulfite exporter TauE/SafE family protein [Fimbriimonadales bacterium]